MIKIKRTFISVPTIALFAIQIFGQVTSEDVVKIDTSLIQLDVSVTDSKGKPVRDLKREDFKVFENGELQPVTTFSFVSQESTSENGKVVTKDGTIIDVPSRKNVRPENIHRTIALVVDDLTLSFESMSFVRRALKKFVTEQVQDGDLVSIIRTGGGIGALQQFTFDKRALLAAIENVKWNPTGVGGISAFAPISATPLEIAKANGAEVDEEDLRAEKAQIRQMNELRSNQFVGGTLGAMNFIIQGMSRLPGRKSIVLLSDGFSLYSKDEAGFYDESPIMNQIRALVQSANRSSVVIYSIDARGLQTLGLTAADNTNSLTQEDIAKRVTERRDMLLDTQAGMEFLSKSTGGFTIKNNNSINGAIDRVLNDQSYYLIGYEPDVDTFDVKKRQFNKLEVKVDRKDAIVRYRSGFFAKPSESNATAETKSNKTPQETVLEAISSPFAVNDIKLSLNTLFMSPGKDVLSLKAFVHIDANDLTFSDSPSGKKTFAFDILAMTFGDNGVITDQIGKTYTFSLDADKVDEFKKRGLVYFLNFAVKKPGGYQMRVALRDHATNKTGSASSFVDVPKLSKKQMTLSGIGLESLTTSQWNAIAKDQPIPGKTDPLRDSSLRKFRAGNILRYALEIYNAPAGSKTPSGLTIMARVFYENKLLFEGKPQPVSLEKTNTPGININGALDLPKSMAQGDYVLQLVVADPQGKKGRNFVTQIIDFSIE